VAGARGIAEAAVWPGSANPHVPPLIYISGLVPAAAALVTHPRGARWRRRDVGRIGLGNGALTVDYDLTRLASCVSRLRDGGGWCDDHHCGYRKSYGNRRQECGDAS
jgi:hypothetical protein